MTSTARAKINLKPEFPALLKGAGEFEQGFRHEDAL